MEDGDWTSRPLWDWEYYDWMGWDGIHWEGYLGLLWMIMIWDWTLIQMVYNDW